MFFFSLVCAVYIGVDVGVDIGIGIGLNIDIDFDIEQEKSVAVEGLLCTEELGTLSTIFKARNKASIYYSAEVYIYPITGKHPGFSLLSAAGRTWTQEPPISGETENVLLPPWAIADDFVLCIGFSLGITEN